ncbi:MAG: Wzz/FepE/Etk N-terminal domain-containing protein [Acidimicrobiales bacterium]|nr:Wzz/FepE/Etk N-terminal domain-containing protein [Acidimicrobiales bacterium]
MVPERDPGEIELRDYLVVLIRRWWVIVVAVVLVVAAAALATFTQPSRYRAEAEVLLTEPSSAAVLGVDVSEAMPAVGDEVRTAGSTEVTDEVRAVVGSEPQLSVRSDEEARLLTFSAVSDSAERAAEAAGLHAQTFIEHRRELLLEEYRGALERLEEREAELTSELDEMRDELAVAEAGVDPESANRSFELDRVRADHHRRAQAVEGELAEVGAQIDRLALVVEFVQDGGAEVVSEAAVPGAPFEPATSRNLALAVVVGLMLGVGAVFVLEYLDRSLCTPRELEAAAMGLPVLATIPRLARSGAGDALALRDAPQSASADSYRVLRAALRSALGPEAGHTLGVVGVTPGCGASTTAANLALACARSGQRVVLVDCDMRQPRIHELFGVDEAPGFTSVLGGDVGLESAAHRLADQSGLVVITAGAAPEDPAELLAGARASSLVASVAAQADLVIVDLPPALAAADVFAAVPWLDGVVVVVEAGRTRDDEVAEVVTEMDRAGARLLGTVLNRGSTTRVTGYGSRRVAPAGRRPDGREPAGPEWGPLPDHGSVDSSTHQ